MSIDTATIIKGVAGASAAIIAAPQSAIAENLAKANFHQLLTLQFNFTVSDFVMIGTFLLLLCNYLLNRKKVKIKVDTEE
jgi:hypothetical protein